MKKKYIVELDEGAIEFAKNFFKEECEDFDVPIVSAIANATPYDEAEVWRKSNELLEKRLKYLGNPKDRWIPVSEKLPELHNSVVATDNNDVFVAWYDEGWKSSDSQFDKHTPIVAWRPIPQYTESEGE